MRKLEADEVIPEPRVVNHAKCKGGKNIAGLMIYVIIMHCK